MEPTFSLSTLSNQLSASQEIASDQTQNVMTALSQHVHKFAEEQSAFGRRFTKSVGDLYLSGETARNEHSLFDQAREYSKDFMRRLILTTDIMRQRADSDAVHEQADCPPVLTYDSEVIVDGRMLQHPVNYLLLKITPPEGVEIKEWKRPYMIIDPRAGHGAGIGGFKSDSQVGVALNDGHPVYFDHLVVDGAESVDRREGCGSCAKHCALRRQRAFWRCEEPHQHALCHVPRG